MASDRPLQRLRRPMTVLAGATAAFSTAWAFTGPRGELLQATRRPSTWAAASEVAAAGPAAPCIAGGAPRAAGAALALAAASLAVRGACRTSRGRKSGVPLRAESEKDGSVQQLLGMKGASETQDEPLWKIRLQLCKPVTWPPLLFGVVAGVCASGNFDPGTASGQDWAKLFTCMLLSGPILVGYTQTLNDWYDKEIDAINEPYRPIPSGRITEEQVFQQIYFLAAAGLILAGVLDVWQGHSTPTVFIVAVIGIFMAYIYSAPPLKLKMNWISGCYALGSSYIALPWWAGQSVFGEVTPEIVVLTLWYSIAAVGIAIVNDFKSIEGDRKMNLSSAPVVFGVETASYMAPIIKDSVQLTIVAYLWYIGNSEYALGLLALMIPQVLFAKFLFLEDPLKNDVKFQGASLPFFSIGTIVAACAIGANPLH